MKKSLSLVFLMLGLSSVPASADSASPTHAAAQKTYAVKGEVVSMDVAHRKIKLKHEAVPELQWPGMTMDFAVADKALLNGLKAGDQVLFRFGLAGGQARITEIQRLK